MLNADGEYGSVTGGTEPTAPLRRLEERTATSRSVTVFGGSLSHFDMKVIVIFLLDLMQEARSNSLSISI